MKEKGFTLIELLAVIVILAIIALIAVPIIINIISETKEKAVKINAQNYMDAVELAVANNHMKEGEKVLISGTYDIIQNGKAIKLIIDEQGNEVPIDNQIEFPVEYTGEGLKSGTVKLIDGKVRKLTGVKTNDGYNIVIILGEVKILKDIKPAILTIGTDFNSKIKTLVSGIETNYSTADTTVKSIEFLGYGMLPSGYTLEDFQKLERVDVSANEDETVYAIYDV